MQKKLLAVAVASALAMPAVAQAQVTLSGNMDLGYQSNSTQAGGVDTDTSTVGVHNGSSTSNVAITAVEDLGGGMQAKIYIETDPAFGSNAGGTFAGSPNWLELSGNFGSVTLGLINNFALTASSTSQPLGTAIGSGYSGGFGRLDGVGVIGTVAGAAVGGAGARDIRINNAIQYKTPSMSGFWAGLQHSIKQDAPAASFGQTQIGGGYSNGPLNVAVAHSTVEANAAFIGTSTDVTHLMVGANYTFGPVTVYGGYTTSEGQNSADVNTSSMNIAAKYAFSSTLAGMVNVVKVSDDNATAIDRDLVGLGLDYSMSKQTTAYVRYESGDTNKAIADTGDFTRLGVGVRKSF